VHSFRAGGAVGPLVGPVLQSQSLGWSGDSGLSQYN
jgi:hypothetical protein